MRGLSEGVNTGLIAAVVTEEVIEGHSVVTTDVANGETGVENVGSAETRPSEETPLKT